MKEEKRNKTIIAITIGLTICFLIFDQAGKSLNKFSSEKWKNNIEHREDMIDDVVRSNVLLGKKEKEIIELLGSPVKYEDKGKLKQLNAKTMKYDLGDDKSGKFKTYLCVDLEKNLAVLVYKYHQKTH